MTNKKKKAPIESITLRGKAAEEFARALLEPPTPNETLLQAMREGRDAIEDRTNTHFSGQFAGFDKMP